MPYSGEPRVSAEEAANKVAYAQSKWGKFFRVVGGVELAAFTGFRLGRLHGDVDISTRRRFLGRALGAILEQFPWLGNRPRGWIVSTYLHPIYSKLARGREKDLQDLVAVYRTWRDLKKKSPLAADLYLDDIAFALAASAHRDPGIGTFAMRPEYLVETLNRLRGLDPGAADFYVEVLRRAARHAPPRFRRMWSHLQPVVGPWDFILRVQSWLGKWLGRRIAKKIKLVGSGELNAVLSPQDRRLPSDVDVSSPFWRVLTFPLRAFAKLWGFPTAHTFGTYFHPAYAVLSRRERVGDFERIYRTYLRLKRKSPLAADLYFGDIGHALVRSLVQDYLAGNRTPFSWKEHISTAIITRYRWLRDRSPELARFFLDLLWAHVHELPAPLREAVQTQLIMLGQR